MLSLAVKVLANLPVPLTSSLKPALDGDDPMNVLPSEKILIASALPAYIERNLPEGANKYKSVPVASTPSASSSVNTESVLLLLIPFLLIFIR
jgi:hypothetical protein